MRLLLAVFFFALVAALVICAVSALNSKKKLANYVAFLVTAMAIPVFGNLFIIASTTELLSTIGCYIYFIGMDAAVYSIMMFTFEYCELEKPKKVLTWPVRILMIIDLIQYALNPWLGFSFKVEQILVDDLPYFRMVPLAGQTYHRIVCYGLFLVSLIFFIVKRFKTPKIYAEKYRILYIAILITGGIESYYIFSRKPMDMSMIGFAVFGYLVYYFVLFYRPLHLLDRMLSNIISDMDDALFLFDINGECVWTNKPAQLLIGGTEGNYDGIKENLSFLFGDIDFSDGWSRMITIGEGDDESYTLLEAHSITSDGKISGSYLAVKDTTEEQKAMKQAMYNATHDSVTGMYTKERLFDRIEKRLKRDKNTDYMIGYLEISNYKVINDVFGTEFGELTERKVADFIREGVSDKCLYGRLSDDSFGILIDKEDFYNKPVDEKLASFTVKDENLEHHVLMHYGVYDIQPDDEIDVPLFFNSARLATSRISGNYQTLIAYYDEKIREEVVHDQLISHQLNEAIATRQIRPYLQPIVNSQGLLEGAEALVRWIHPEDGFMNPGSFIPVFEKNGLIAEVDKYMWRCACEILTDWRSRGIEAFISVNISPKDFYFMDVEKEIKALVEEFGLEPRRLRIEITETVMMSDTIDLFKIIANLREYGFLVEMDDFGSGYSSLNVLKDMPVDVLKIDMMFLKDSERNMKCSTIIRNIIRMSEELDIDSLTEGVETAAQFEKLYAMGCKLYQGYYFSKPLPLDEFEKQWLD